MGYGNGGGLVDVESNGYALKWIAILFLFPSVLMGDEFFRFDQFANQNLLAATITDLTNLTVAAGSSPNAIGTKYTCPGDGWLHVAVSTRDAGTFGQQIVLLPYVNNVRQFPDLYNDTTINANGSGIYRVSSGQVWKVAVFFASQPSATQSNYTYWAGRFEPMTNLVVVAYQMATPPEQMWAFAQIFFGGFLTELVFLLVGKIVGSLKVFSGIR